MDWETFETEHGIGLLYFYNEKAPNSSRLLLIGDSFRSSMVPSLREQFTDVYVIHRANYTTDILEDIRPEFNIDEYVERYSGDIEDIEYLLQ